MILDALPDADQPRPDAAPPGYRAGLVDELRARVTLLERQLDLERDANRENRRQLADLERILALEPPEKPESASEPVSSTEKPSEQNTPRETRPLRRMFGR